MPKVYLSEEDKLNNRITSWVYGQMKTHGITQQALADELGISQQLLCYRLKHKKISISDFATFVRLFQPETNEIMYLIGR